MNSGFLPLFVTPCTISNHKTTFYKIHDKVTVEAPGKLMRQLVRACDGVCSLSDIVQSLKKEWDAHSVRGLLKELRQRNILVDSRYVSDALWETVENPSRFPSLIADNDIVLFAERAKERHRRQGCDKIYQASDSTLCELINRRRSVRSFSEQPVRLQSVVDMLWSAYGETRASNDGGTEVLEGRRAVPSAGALYPLVISVALFRDTEELSSGIYDACMGSPGTVGFSPVSGDTEQFIRAFADPLMLNKAHGVIVVSGSFHTTGEKYGNRSMLYVALEAGHTAQNIHLAAVESGVATVEIGGFVEHLLAEVIKLQKHYRPLTTVVFGYEDKTIEVNASKQEVEVRWAVPLAGQYRPPFAIALARVSTEINEDWSYGRDALPSLAHTKAVAEAKEWAACGCVPGALIRSRFRDLVTAIDPRTIIRFHPTQYRMEGFPFKMFNETLGYEWVEGYDEITGSAVYILADLVYFPYYPKTPPYAYANSSGVAAHPDRQKAVETSTLELIERDAFMITYLIKLISPAISDHTLPQYIQRRIQGLKRMGFKVWVRDHSLDLAPVVFVFAQNEELAYTTCASCSSFDTEHAVSHALMEVEASALARLQNGPARFKQPEEVVMPFDHGALYEQRQYFRRADFLIRNRITIAFRDVGRNVARSWQGLLNRFAAKGWRLITVPLFLSEEYGGNGDLHVIRSLVPGIVPMTFGNRQEPAGMERIYAVAEERGGRMISYRDLPKFPHPFA